MNKIYSFILLLSMIYFSQAQESDSVFNCKCLEKVNKDYITDSLFTEDKGWLALRGSGKLQSGAVDGIINFFCPFYFRSLCGKQIRFFTILKVDDVPCPERMVC